MTSELNLDERSEVGRRLKRIRVLREMSVADLAERAQIPRSYVYALEAGRRISVWNLRAVAVALRTTTDYLLGLESEKSEGDGPCCPCWRSPCKALPRKCVHRRFEPRFAARTGTVIRSSCDFFTS